MPGHPQPKQDDFAPHPVKEQLPGIEYCVNSPPPWPEAVLLGFQHYLVMLGTTVLIPTILVPQMGGGNKEKAQVIQTLLFVAGLNTYFQLFFGSRLPTVIGGSNTFIVPTISIILAKRYSNVTDPHQRFLQTMRGIQGALIIASCFQIIIGFSGLWRNVVRFLCPLSAVPIVTLAGLGLYQLGFPAAAKCIEIGLPQIVLLVLFSQFLPNVLGGKRAVVDRFSVLLSVAFVWVFAHILTVGGAYDHRPQKTQQHCRTDRAGLVNAAPWIRVPYPFQWGAPTFDAGEAFAMTAASFAALIESTGTLIAVSRYSGATHPPPSILGRGALWQGIGILLGGMFGTANGSTASVENAGLLALTRVGSRRVILISAGFMVVFSTLGKIGALFASVPLPIIAAVYCILFIYVASAGLGFLQFCNLNSFRTKFILGLSFFLGLSVPQFFNEYALVSGHGPVGRHPRWVNLKLPTMVSKLGRYRYVSPSRTDTDTSSTVVSVLGRYRPFGQKKEIDPGAQLDDTVSVVFSSPATVAAIVAFFLDRTLQCGHPSTRIDSGSHWWEKFRSFKADQRSEEFYSLPYNLNKYFPSV